jgi:hypothetical protein
MKTKFNMQVLTKTKVRAGVYMKTSLGLPSRGPGKKGRSCLAHRPSS